MFYTIGIDYAYDRDREYQPAVFFVARVEPSGTVRVVCHCESKRGKEQFKKDVETAIKYYDISPNHIYKEY